MFTEITDVCSRPNVRADNKVSLSTPYNIKDTISYKAHNGK